MWEKSTTILSRLLIDNDPFVSINHSTTLDKSDCTNLRLEDLGL